MRLKYLLSISLLILMSSPLLAQKEIKYSRKGNKEYKGSMYEDAELLYRRSIDENPAYNDAMFNLGNAMYKQEKYEDAVKNFETLASTEIDPLKRSSSFYNLGNTLLQSNKLEESIEAYKNSLRLNPGNHEAKYNLAYAQDLLKQQQEQEKQDKQNQNQKDNKEGQDKQDKKQDKDQGNQQDENKDQENQDKKNEEQNPEDQKKEQKKDDQMSIEDAERLLQALAADEQKVQDKVKKAKASKRRVRTLKNW